MSWIVSWLYSVMVRGVACHAGDPGSIPAQGRIFFHKIIFLWIFFFYLSNFRFAFLLTII